MKSVPKHQRCNSTYEMVSLRQRLEDDPMGRYSKIVEFDDDEGDIVLHWNEIVIEDEDGQS